jgi:hypothetical protein
MSRPKPVLRPKGKHEDSFDFRRRVEAQAKCSSYSIPPRGAHEDSFDFRRRLQACEDAESDEHESEEE